MRISDWSSDVCSSDLNRVNACLTLRRPAQLSSAAVLERGGDGVDGELDAGDHFFVAVGAAKAADKVHLQQVQRLDIEQAQPDGGVERRRMRKQAALSRRVQGREAHASELQSLMRISSDVRFW